MLRAPPPPPRADVPGNSIHTASIIYYITICKEEKRLPTFPDLQGLPYFFFSIREKVRKKLGHVSSNGKHLTLKADCKVKETQEFLEGTESEKMSPQITLLDLKKRFTGTFKGW